MKTLFKSNNNSLTNSTPFSFIMKCPECRNSVMDICTNQLTQKKEFVCIVKPNEHIVTFEIKEVLT